MYPGISCVSWEKMETMFTCLEMKKETLQLLSDCLMYILPIGNTRHKSPNFTWETKVQLAKEEGKEERDKFYIKCPWLPVYHHF